LWGGASRKESISEEVEFLPNFSFRYRDTKASLLDRFRQWDQRHTSKVKRSIFTAFCCINLEAPNLPNFDEWQSIPAN